MLRQDTRNERIAARVAIAASVFFALVAGWELLGPLPGGHLGNAAGAAIAGENMLHWRLFAAVLDYTHQRPLPGEYYTHHPYGVFVNEALAHVFFGHGWATVRIPALFMSALTPPLLYLFSRALWGALPAAVVTVAFVLTPIDLAYASFHNLEGATIFFGLLFSWGTVRLFQSWRGVYLWPSAIGALGACQGDWVGLVLVGTVGILAFTRAYLLPARAFGHVDHRQHGRWFAFSTAAAVVTLILYVALFAKAGKLADLMGSYESRKAGAEAPWSAIFSQRRVMWLTWMLPKISLVAIALGAPLHLGRAWFPTRRFEELLPLAWLSAASFQYFVFKQGADVHIFWPHYYGVVSALGFGVVVATCLPLADRAAARSPVLARWAPLLVLGPVALVLLLVGRVGLTILYQSRLTGGRFDDGGRYIAVDQDRSQFAKWAFSLAKPAAVASLHRSFYPHWYIEYGLHRPVHQLPGTPTPATSDDPARIALLDARNTPTAELIKVAKEFSPEIVGPFWRIDRAAGPGNLRALRYQEREPGLLERYFVTGSDLVRTIGPDEDTLRTWEWRDAFNLAAAPPNSGDPADADDARILFNAAVARGDTAAAARLRPLAEKLVTTRTDAAYTRGIRLIGMNVERGAATVVTLLFATADDYVPVDADYLVRSFVDAPPPVWVSATDYFEKEVAPPMALHPALWKPGRLYMNRFVAMRRVGTERFEGTFTAHAGIPPTLVDGRARLPLFVLR